MFVREKLRTEDQTFTREIYLWVSLPNLQEPLALASTTSSNLLLPLHQIQPKVLEKPP